MDKVKLIDETIQVLTINKDDKGNIVRNFEKGMPKSIDSTLF